MGRKTMGEGVKRVHVRRGDTVKVLSGKDAGKIAKVLRVYPETNRVILEALNFMKRHTRAQAIGGGRGGVVEKEAPLSASNVILVCTKCNSPTRVAHKFLEDGSKVRQCKKCGEVLDEGR